MKIINIFGKKKPKCKLVGQGQIYPELEGEKVKIFENLGFH